MKKSFVLAAALLTASPVSAYEWSCTQERLQELVQERVEVGWYLGRFNIMCDLDGNMDKAMHRLLFRGEITRLLNNPRKSVREEVKARMIDFYPSCLKQVRRIQPIF